MPEVISEVFDQHWDRGWALFEAGEFEEAIVEWRAAADLDLKDGYVLNNIGCALSKLGRKEKAITEWRKAVQLEPDYDNPHTNLAYALSAAGCSPEALAAVRAAIRLNSDDVNLYNYLGFHLLVQADENKDKAGWEAATAAFQQAINVEPKNSYACRHLARAQWCLKRKREAIRTLKAAIVVSPDDAAAYIQLERCQVYSGRIRDASRTIQLIHNLPQSEEVDAFFADLDRTVVRGSVRLGIGACLIGVVLGGWIWYRRWG